jgi:carbonic anhydrase/acetyltransferase-like protein (isoleucine patch superfamily)
MDHAGVFDNAVVSDNAVIKGNAHLYTGTTSKANDYLCVGPIGSRDGYTTIHLLTQMVSCGGFRGTLKEFTKQVKRVHQNNPFYLYSYLGLINMVNLMLNK